MACLAGQLLGQQTAAPYPTPSPTFAACPWPGWTVVPNSAICQAPPGSMDCFPGWVIFQPGTTSTGVLCFQPIPSSHPSPAPSLLPSGAPSTLRPTAMPSTLSPTTCMRLCGHSPTGTPILCPCTDIPTPAPSMPTVSTLSPTTCMRQCGHFGIPILCPCTVTSTPAPSMPTVPPTPRPSGVPRCATGVRLTPPPPPLIILYLAPNQTNLAPL